MKTNVFLAVCSALALAAAGCGDDGGRSVDSGPSIELDGGGDGGGTDTEGGTDAGTDAGGSVSCDVGQACDPMRGCRVSPDCLAEQNSTLGTAGTDEIQGHPEGATTVPYTLLHGGYCTTFNTEAMGGCDPDNADSCGGEECAKCEILQYSDSGEAYTGCLKSCTPSLTENPCRDHYSCLIGSDACWIGCNSDDECAIYREDTNGNGVIDVAEGDRLVYDTAGNWSCNMTTYRCEHDGTAGAEAGDPCVLDSDCEANARCLDEAGTEGAWPGGYCLKFGCDLPDNACAGDGLCTDRAFGFAVCLEPCTVANTVTDGDPLSGSADCREGYACMWDGTSGETAGNGGCIPGDFTEVTEPNTGAACTDVDDCYSPYGAARCLDWDGDTGPAGSTCTVLDCSAPGVPSDICGTGALCARVSGSSTSWCLQTCTAAEDCTDGQNCWDTTVASLSTGGSKVCFPGCLEDADCRSGETCIGATSSSLGECG